MKDQTKCIHIMCGKRKIASDKYIEIISFSDILFYVGWLLLLLLMFWFYVNICVSLVCFAKMHTQYK